MTVQLLTEVESLLVKRISPATLPIKNGVNGSASPSTTAASLFPGPLNWTLPRSEGDSGPHASAAFPRIDPAMARP